MRIYYFFKQCSLDHVKVSQNPVTSQICVDAPESFSEKQIEDYLFQLNPYQVQTFSASQELHLKVFREKLKGFMESYRKDYELPFIPDIELSDNFEKPINIDISIVTPSRTVISNISVPRVLGFDHIVIAKKFIEANMIELALRYDSNLSNITKKISAIPEVGDYKFPKNFTTKRKVSEFERTYADAIKDYTNYRMLDIPVKI